MAVNYQVDPLNVVVTPGQTIAEGFTTASSGTDPSSLYVAIAAISPINDSVYEVNYNDFNVSGATGEAGVTSVGANFNEFVAGGTGVILPDGVDKVRFTDNGIAGQVSMEVYFNPTYVIPIDALNPFPVIIDIDGDASEIVDPGPVSGNVSSFRLEVNLSDPNPNAKVFCVIPPSIGANTLQNSAAWNIGAEIDTTDYTKSTALFTPGATTTEQTPIFAGDGFAGMNLSHAWFWIVPDPGYSVSKFNFQLGISSASPQFDNQPGLTANPYYNALSYVSLVSTPFNNLNYSPSNTITNQTDLIGNLSSGSYSYSGWSNPIVRITYPPVAPATTTTTSLINYNSLVQDAVLNNYSQFAQILLVDTTSFYNIYPASFVPTDSQLSSLQSAEAPSGYATSDWADNAILVVLNGFYNYIPGTNTPDLKINISGSAMPLDGEQSNEFNFFITDDE